jgi:hypothetical protein
MGVAVFGSGTRAAAGPCPARACKRPAWATTQLLRVSRPAHERRNEIEGGQRKAVGQRTGAAQDNSSPQRQGLHGGVDADKPTHGVRLRCGGTSATPTITHRKA